MSCKKFKFAGIEIDCLTIEEALEKLEEIVRNNRKGYIVTPNAAHIVMLQKDREFELAYKKASLVLPDGISLILASKILGGCLKQRVPGADLFLEICKISAKYNKNIFILGGKNGSEKIAVIRLKKMFPNINILGYSPPFGFEVNQEENKKIINEINKLKPGVLFLFIGAPRGEKWIYSNIDKLEVNLACQFGAALDFFIGNLKRAPKWMQKIGLEWFWRLLQEPRRLWKRYLIGNIIFVLLVLKELVILSKRKN